MGAGTSVQVVSNHIDAIFPSKGYGRSFEANAIDDEMLEDLKERFDTEYQKWLEKCKERKQRAIKSDKKEITSHAARKDMSSCAENMTELIKQLENDGKWVYMLDLSINTKTHLCSVRLQFDSSLQQHAQSKTGCQDRKRTLSEYGKIQRGEYEVSARVMVKRRI